MNCRFLLSSVFVLGSLATVAFASAATQAASAIVDGSVQYQINVSPIPAGDLRTYSAEEFSGYKTISLMHLAFSEEMLAKAATIPAASGETDFGKTGAIKPFNTSSGAVDLGMNNVPVLDQGSYGTCVTFSSAGALDTFLGKDTISQQCSLELDIADPADDTYSQGGLAGNYWNGAYLATQVINPILKQGFMSKTSCKTAYPSPSTTIKLADYQKSSDKTSLSKVTVNYHATNSIDLLKAALNAGHRMVFSSMIGPSVSGYNISIGGSQKSGGLWACQQASQDTANNCNGSYAGGHEIIAIGYDDAQQLIKIRNSWNTVVGDSGNYYMTYAYYNYWSTFAKTAGYIADGTELY